MLQAREQRAAATLWRAQVHEKINWELFDRGVEAFTWAALEELARAARSDFLLSGARDGAEFARFVERGRPGAATARTTTTSILEPFVRLRSELEKPFAESSFLWRATGGPKGDLVAGDGHASCRCPAGATSGRSRSSTASTCSRPACAPQIGVKVFGPDLTTIDRVCKEIEQALKPIKGAQDVLAEPIMGKGYLEIKIDREKAARYGVSVGDIQDTIEVALGGRVITQTVEGRDRFPVRVRYARDFREDEEAVKRLLVSRGGMARRAAAVHADSRLMRRAHRPAPVPPPRARCRRPPPLQVPLAEVADVRIVEGPAMIKSENGRLRNYVTLNVRGDRDMVGFVEEAQRVVAEKVHAARGRPPRVERRVRAPGPGRQDAALHLPGRDRADLRDPLPDVQGPGRRRR